MERKYVIQSLIDLGYWSDSRRDFTGIIFASRFPSVEVVEDYMKESLPKFIPKQILTIIPVYEIESV